jgi:hypothetical protein
VPPPPPPLLLLVLLGRRECARSIDARWSRVVRRRLPPRPRTNGADGGATQRTGGEVIGTSTTNRPTDCYCYRCCCCCCCSWTACIRQRSFHYMLASNHSVGINSGAWSDDRRRTSCRGSRRLAGCMRPASHRTRIGPVARTSVCESLVYYVRQAVPSGDPFHCPRPLPIGRHFSGRRQRSSGKCMQGSTAIGAWLGLN